MMDRYLKALCNHIRETGPQAPAYRVDTVYFGGGTPTYFGGDRLSAVLATVRESFDVDPEAEITFEANPDSVNLKMLRRLRREGFNRISLGVQTDDDELLSRLGRPHTYADAEEAVRLARKAGFRNLSVDLMFGLENQTPHSWLNTLDHVLELKPEHISCYGLRVEESTPLNKYYHLLELPSDDQQADMYLSAVELLRRRGYHQYEISNFAQRGKLSKHNMKYWTGKEYLGFGPCASSDFAGKRFEIVASLRQYVEGIENHTQILGHVHEIPPRERAGEYIITRLRTILGITRKEFEATYLLNFDPMEEVLEKCFSSGHAICINDRWRLTPEGMLISNYILSDLLNALDDSIKLEKRR
jgi:oxygen-independent coproporphyrinogen-3 oxidase